MGGFPLKIRSEGRDELVKTQGRVGAYKVGPLFDVQGIDMCMTHHLLQFPSHQVLRFSKKMVQDLPGQTTPRAQD